MKYPTLKESIFFKNPQAYLFKRKAYELELKVKKFIQETENIDNNDLKIPMKSVDANADNKNVEVYAKDIWHGEKPNKDASNGIMNMMIDMVPFELLLRGYNYCGPGWDKCTGKNCEQNARHKWTR